MMATFAELFADAFRPFNTDGVPASGTYKPEKSRISAIGAALDAAISSAVQGMVTYATVSDLPISPTPSDGTQARVFDDPTETNNVVWKYTDGAWAIDDAFYSGLSVVVQPLVDQAEAASTAAQNAASPIRPGLADPARSIYDSRDNAIGAGLGTDGVISDLDDDWSVTDWLPVRPNGKMKLSQAQTYPGAGFGVVFFNSSRQFVSAVEGNITAGELFDVPSAAVYARFTIETARAPGMVVTDADYSGMFSPADGQVLNNAREAADIVRSALSSFGTNIASLSSIVPGALSADLGSLDFSGSFITATIAIDPSVPLRFGAQTGLSDGYGPTFTDAIGVRIWARREVTADGDIIQPPPQAAFVRVPLSASLAADFTLRMWGTVPPWASVNPWSGRQAAIMGDSITANYNWFGDICALFDMTLKTRAAKAGRIMASALLAADDVTPLDADDFTGVSLTWLFLGTNQDADTPIGTLADNSAVATFAGQTRKAIESVMTWNPSQRFVVSSLLHRADQDAKVQQAREMLEALASEYALPFFDARKLAGISPFNQATMIPDGLHPGSSVDNIGYSRGLIPAARGFIQALAPIAAA